MDIEAFESSSAESCIADVIENLEIFPKVGMSSVWYREKIGGTLSYLDSYLSTIKARAMVIEREYIDRDFLDDYTRYYARCFGGYPRTCCRIHFFSAREDGPFDIERFTGDVRGFITRTPQGPDLQSCYLGFVVVRPLVLSPLGRTCLKYPDEVPDPDGRRYHKVWRKVRVSFFGRELYVDRCMPFLQQDSVSAACATCALWSAFSITSEVFGDRHYCPGCITSMAMDHGVSLSRCFPNSGLNAEDMTHAIRRIGLDPVLVQRDKITLEQALNWIDNERHSDQERHGGLVSIVKKILSSRSLPDEESSDGVRSILEWIKEKERAFFVKLFNAVYAYTEARIPVVLGGEIIDGKGASVGLHAVAVNGYHLGKNIGVYAETELNNTGVCHESWRIDKLYVHDDRIGPSAEMELKSDCTLSTHYGEKFRVLWFLVPLYAKIRVECEDVSKYVAEMSGLIKEAQRQSEAREKLADLRFQHDKCDWEICLQSGAVFKESLGEDSNLTEDEKFGHLVKSYPKYVWKVCLTYGELPCCCFVVDATDKGEGLVVIDVIVYHDHDDGDSDDSPETVVMAIIRLWEILATQEDCAFPEEENKDIKEILENGWKERCRELERNPLFNALGEAMAHGKS